ncbi:MAG: hypothetical protein AB7Q97_04785 [Gammaproteobacteria bacterium]
MDKKLLEETKKEIAKKVKALAQEAKKTVEETKKLRDERDCLEEKKDATPQDGKRLFDVRKSLKDLENSYLERTGKVEDQISGILKTNVPDEKKDWPDWQKGMDKWYRDLVEKESGLDVGKDLKLTGEVSIKDKKATLILKGKF